MRIFLLILSGVLVLAGISLMDHRPLDGLAFLLVSLHTLGMSIMLTLEKTRAVQTVNLIGHKSVKQTADNEYHIQN